MKVFTTVLALSLALSNSANDLQVKTRTNILQGISSEDGSINTWLGNPFCRAAHERSPLEVTCDETIKWWNSIPFRSILSILQSLGEFGPHKQCQWCLTMMFDYDVWLWCLLNSTIAAIGNSWPRQIDAICPIKGANINSVCQVLNLLINNDNKT